MLNMIVNGEHVSYDSFDEAQDAARDLGQGICFWQETLSECAENGANWSEFLNDLWQSGAEDEARRIDDMFQSKTPRHWLLIALTLLCDDPWQGFLTEWRMRGDDFVLSAVGSSAFALWLKLAQPTKYDLLVRAFGDDAVKWSNEFVLRALRSDGSAAEVAEWQTAVKAKKLPKPGDEMTINLPGGATMTFCWCPATTSDEWMAISDGKDYFLMGSPDSEMGHSDDETQHQVRLTHGFWIGKFEVTQEQWSSVMGENPARFQGASRPVENVSWTQCQKYIEKINAEGNAKVSLPTEAQWEYACRAGTTTPFNFGAQIDFSKGRMLNLAIMPRMMFATYLNLSQQGTAAVGSYPPNAWGIYDMHGNVWEWCQDCYAKDYRAALNLEAMKLGFGLTMGHSMSNIVGQMIGHVFRGGSWKDLPSKCRAATRNKGSIILPPEHFDVGLRLVCSRKCEIGS